MNLSISRLALCRLTTLVLLFAGLPSAWSQTSVVLNASPTRVVGQVSVTQQTSAPNLVEGRELYAPQSIALDTSVTPPILYVADTFNNRVLAFKNVSSLTKGNFADKVIGQRDFFSTLAQGPNSGSGGLSTGLNFPTSVAVDKSGNLYVVDAGNQRILRYPTPLKQTGDLLPVDLVIGQRTVSSGTSANEGNQNPSAKTIAVAVPGNGVSSSLAFDSLGNLWLTDTANNRVLRFPVSQLAAGTVEPAADLVLGQTDFVTRTQPTPPTGTAGSLYKGSLVIPTGIAFDQNGRLYVADGFQRVLFFSPPLATGSFAQRILGVQVQVQGQPTPTYPNEVALGGLTTNTPCEGLLVINNNLFVADPASHRIVRYDTPESWPVETATVPSPSMKSVIGQSDFNQGKLNRGGKEASAVGLASPFAMAYTGNELLVADTGNNRVLAFPVSGDLGFAAATRVVGQVDFPYFSPNLVEGREIFVYGGNSNGLVTGGSGVVIDKNSNPPHLYIADSLNNRVLGYADARRVRPGDKADLVIGQMDFFRTIVNSPVGDPGLPTDTGLFGPTGLAVDANGNLWVADTVNGRLLRFPSPFTQPSLTNQKATLVLGQSNFFQKITDAGVANMRNPYGVTLLQDGSVAASDVAHNRVLIFRKPAGAGDFQNGQAASVVYGQPDFSSATAGVVTSTNSQLNRFNRPTHIAADTDDRLFVADTGNNRILVFTRPPMTGSNLTSTVQINGVVNGAHGLTVSPLTGELWVADTFNNRVLRFPQYDTLLLNPQGTTFTINATAPLAVCLDELDNLLVVESSNRVSFFFQQLTFQNAANFATRSLAPGMLAYIYRFGRPFENWDTSKSVTGIWGTTTGDVQVLVNGAPAPVYELIPGRVDIQVPMSAPTSGTAEFQVVRASTGQVLGVGLLPMNVADPGLFATGGVGQLAATNEDGTVNGPGNGAARGKIVTLYGTGQGFVPNAPPDGQAESAPTPTPVRPRVFIAGVAVKDADILYSGLTAFPAGWQINVKVPDPEAAPGMANLVLVTMQDIKSNVGATGQTITTTIFVK